MIKHSEEFKQEAVRIALTSGLTVFKEDFLSRDHRGVPRSTPPLEDAKVKVVLCTNRPLNHFSVLIKFEPKIVCSTCRSPKQMEKNSTQFLHRLKTGNFCNQYQCVTGG
jgi:hypothetical protein